MFGNKRISIFNKYMEEFKQLELHDQGIEHLEFDFGKNEIRISFSMYDEKISDYIIAGYEFSNVHSLEISRMDLKKFSELAIYSHKVIARPEGDFSFRLEVLQGAG